MQFEAHTLQAPFDALVESVFHYKEFQPDHSIERVVPTGHIFVLFELDGIERNTFDNTTLEPLARFRSAWISGTHRNYMSISAHPDSEMFVIQFKAHGARPFLHLSMSELSDKVVAGSDIFDGELLTLRERLVSAPTVADKFSVADSWLAARFDKNLLAPPSIVQVVERLQAEPASKFNDVIDQYENTPKHLIAQFKKFVGITPKHYQRILRFNDVFAQMQGDQFMSWSDIAHSCGYSDQSHFIREFRNFSGFNPEAYLKEAFDEDATNFFPLDREG